MRAAAYEVGTGDAPAFLKVRFGPVADAPLEVPRALLDAGARNVPRRRGAGVIAAPPSARSGQRVRAQTRHVAEAEPPVDQVAHLGGPEDGQG